MTSDTPQPAMLPLPHSGHVEQVLSAISLLRSRSANPSTSYNLSDSPSGEAVVAICGGRGAGKSTVLEAVRTRLSEMADLVLPTIKPEFFSSSDTVLGMAIAHLRATVEKSYSDLLQHEIDGEVTFGTFLNRLLRRASIIGHRELSSTSRQGQGLEAIADDFMRSASVGSAFVEQWCYLVARTLDWIDSSDESESTKVSRPLLIISVDDADLAPELLPRILVDLRVMIAASRVICLVCVDPSEARRALGERYLENYPNLRMLPGTDSSFTAPIYSVVEGQLAKAIPPQWTVTIRELTLQERLAFSPLGVDQLKPMSSLLESFELPAGAVPVASLKDLFVFGHNGLPTPYARCLSGNPRDLEILHFQLEQARTMGPNATEIAARALIYHGLSYGLRNSSNIQIAPADLVYFDDTTTEETIGTSFNKVTFAGRMLSDRLLIEAKDLPEGSEIRLAQIEETIGGYNNGEQKAFRNTQRLHNAAVNSLLLTREFGYAHQIMREDLSGRAVMGGNRTSGVLQLRLGRHETDQRFLMLPQWEAYLDYFLVAEAWRLTIESLRPIANQWTDHRDAMALVTLEWWRILANIQAERAVPRDIGSLFGASSVEGESSAGKASEAFGAAWESLTEIYVKELSHDCGRARDFVSWFESYLLFSCYGDLQHQWFSDRIITSRNKLLERVGRLSIANGRFVAALSARLRRVTDEPWIMPYVELLKRFDLDAGEEIERLHNAAAQERARATISVVGAETVRSASVPAVTGSGGDARAESPEALYRVAMKVLDELYRDASNQVRP